MVQCKKAVQSFKTKKVIQLPPELWQRAEGQHEAIIDMDTWNTVQCRLEKNKRQTTKTTADDGASLFANIVYCKDCNSRLVFNSTKKGTKTKKYYRCSRYIQHGKEACTPHRINQHLLSQIVLEDIQRNAKLAIVDEQTFVQRLHEMNMSECMAEINRLRKLQTEAATA